MRTRTAWLQAQDLNAEEWRADYYLSPASALAQLGRDWPKLAEWDCSFHDGWRFSESPESDWWLFNVELRDPKGWCSDTREYPKRLATEGEKLQAKEFRAAISGSRYFRMRHMHNMRLVPQAEQMHKPTLAGQDYCVQPHDVVVRRVGHAGAAYVSLNTRRHPIDANLAIVRGLSPLNAMWLAFCLEQPIYRAYLERQQSSLTALVRIGLKQLKSMPVAPCPEEFSSLVTEYWAALNQLEEADESLYQLRQSVVAWLEQEYQELAQPEPCEMRQSIRSQFFSIQDIGDRLDYASAAHNQYRRRLMEMGGFPIPQLARVGLDDESEEPASYKVLRISDLDDSFMFPQQLLDGQEVKWRTKKIVLKQHDVLVSSFAKDVKLTYVDKEPKRPVLPTEQLISIRFHQTPGAYALVMETPMVSWQLEQLATGNIQRFVQPSALTKLVLPKLDNRLAQDWHRGLRDCMDRRRSAQLKLDDVRHRMKQVFDRVHSNMRVGVSSDWMTGEKNESSAAK